MKKTGQFAEKVFRQSRKPVFVSCGEKGIISCDDQGVHEIRGLSFLKRLDTVGAGDTVMSALALSLACGISPEESAVFANFAAAVTVQKIFTTGTASGEEILAVAADPDFVFRPDLADGLADAEYLPGSQIEICDGDFIRGKTSARHAVFDHDGTISTLRRGWEQVMEKIMIDAITAGAGIERVRAFLPRIRGRVREYIEKSTGVQTILQMQALVEMVREFDLADAEQRSDKSGYKKIYNQALSDHIRNRLTLVRENLFMRDDYTISGAVPFMKELRNRGVKLYLASGTDKQYVEEEAAIMGYADLFDGGIYGALDDVTRFSKKMVIENIIKSNSLKGDELVVFGDGPVEIRESIKQGGLAIGVATDEERMTGINQRKRTRLIKAGAQLIISDFGEYEKLIELLTGS